MARLKVRLYVQSVKSLSEGYVTNVKSVTGRGGWVVEAGIVGQGKMFKDASEPPLRRGSRSLFARETYDYVLPENQREAVETVRRVASKLGFDVEVLDVGRENVLSRAIRKEVEEIRAFPTLVVSSGRRVEGSITEQQVGELLSGAAGRRRKLSVASAISPRLAAFFEGVRPSARQLRQRLAVFLRFVFFLEKDPKHGVMQNDTLFIHLEAVFAILWLPVSVSCLFVWVYYGLAMCLGYVALVSFLVLETFHFAFDR